MGFNQRMQDPFAVASWPLRFVHEFASWCPEILVIDSLESSPMRAFQGGSAAGIASLQTPLVFEWRVFNSCQKIIRWFYRNDRVSASPLTHRPPDRHFGRPTGKVTSLAFEVPRIKFRRFAPLRSFMIFCCACQKHGLGERHLGLARGCAARETHE